MPTVTFKIPQRLSAELDSLARQSRVPKSQILREALEERIKRARRKQAPRAIDLVRDLAGSVRGPRDLSTNPKYLEDLGA